MGSWVMACMLPSFLPFLPFCPRCLELPLLSLPPSPLAAQPTACPTRLPRPHIFPLSLPPPPLPTLICLPRRRGRARGALLPATRAAEHVGLPTRLAGPSFVKVCGAASDALVASAAAGMVFTSLQMYPEDMEGSGSLVRAGFGTSISTLARALKSYSDFKDSPPAGRTTGWCVSEFTEEKLGELQVKYDAVERAGGDLVAAGSAYEGGAGRVFTYAAEQLALRNILHSVFGLSRQPDLGKKARDGGAGGAAGGDAAAAAAAGVPALPKFLEDPAVHAVWAKSWGLGCFQMLALRRKDMIALVRLLCEKFGAGKLLMYNPTTAKTWKSKLGAAMVPSTTPYDPEDSSRIMALCSKVFIPAGLVEAVCTDEQKKAAAGGAFVVRYNGSALCSPCWRLPHTSPFASYLLPLSFPPSPSLYPPPTPPSFAAAGHGPCGEHEVAG